MTSIMLLLGIPLIPMNYSLIILIITLSLFIVSLNRKIDFKFDKSEFLLIIIAFSFYVILLLYFSKLPRLFTADETSYIFSSRMGISNGVVPPMGVGPNHNEISALLRGRYLWIYLLISFAGSTGLPVYQAGLLSVSYLIMVALTSSLFVKNKLLRIAVFVLIVLNPLLFSFSALVLNDLAISFYALFATLFFVNSFTKNNGDYEIRIKNLLYSLIGIIFLIMIKPNIIILISMWLILVFIIYQYKLYKRDWKYKILLYIMILPFLVYELCIDLPYVISVWLLRSRELGAFFGKFLFVSPAERLISLFTAPWWNPTAPTLFTRDLAEYLDYFYRIFMPESSSILVSAIILALPVIALSKYMRNNLEKTLLAMIILVSLVLFYPLALTLLSLSDAARLSLWMVPLWVPLTITVLEEIIRRNNKKLLCLVLVSALVLLYVNSWLSENKGGVYIGYGLPSRLRTTNPITFQLLMVTMCLPFIIWGSLKIKLIIKNKIFLVRVPNIRDIIFGLLIILIILNEIYFCLLFMEKSQIYKEHDLIKVGSILDKIRDKRTLIFVNNYIYMRTYISDELFKNGLLLPFPDTREEFLKLLKIAPNNTLFLISDDSATTWYEYANKYIKNYMDFEVIIPEKPNIANLLVFNLTEPVLKMSFEDADEVVILDESVFKNDGKNHGAKITEGYHGKALQFDGKGYVSIPNSEVLNFRDKLTISFFAKIDEAAPSKGYMILSKGYASLNGSYSIFIWDGKIYFELGGVGYVYVPAEPYVGAWHHFVFTYNGDKIMIYIDGVPVASKKVSGSIRTSSFDLEIGRDSEGKTYYFVGLIDELQMYNYSLDSEELVKSYYTVYAFRVNELSLKGGQAVLFSSFRNKNVSQGATVKDLRVNIDKNLTVIMRMQIESNEPKNISILIATDRFTKVYTLNLNQSLNNLEFRFDYVDDPPQYKAGGIYWIHLAQARVVVIENDIIYNSFITIQDMRLMNIFLFVILLGILLSYLFLVIYDLKK
ncbi:MAG: LamG-like jellyroll fold domain-containing protein [Thermofilaceae archaeon]